MINFDLFIQSTYSLNGSIIDIDSLVKQAVEKGYKTLGLVDHNHMYGAIKFYKKCLASNIKPIIGLELSLESNFFGALDLVLLSKNNTGYKNLIQISSLIGTLGTLHLDDIKHVLKDVAIIIKSDEGVFSSCIFEEDIVKAKDILKELSNYSNQVFIGLDLNDYSIELKVAPLIKDLGNAIIINKVKYFNKDDLKTSNILSKILK